jgi:metallo-beta-lactamase class B
MRRPLAFFSAAVAVFAASVFDAHAEPPSDTASQLSVAPLSVRRIDLSSELYLRQIGKGVFVITHSFPWPANSVLVEMQNGTLVIAGSQYTPEAAQAVLNWAEMHFGHRQAIAIDTGYHVDNLGGNKAFIDAGIPVYGSALTVELLHERGESTRKALLAMIGDTQSVYYRGHAKMDYVPPDHVFPVDKGLDLNIGDERVSVIYPGPSQAPDKVAVYFPSRKLLFGSCMILGGATIGNVADADTRQWPVSVRKLLSFPADVVVPGHGERLDPGLVQHTIDLLGATR